MIHHLPEDFVFEEPSHFTDPFRYVPHPAVKEAARLVIERIQSDKALDADFSEGKMLGVLVCRSSNEAEGSAPSYIAAFSGSVGGRSVIEGFVPPIYDLLNPDGEFKRREAEISEINRQIQSLQDSDRLMCLERELADVMHGREVELTAMKEVMALSKARREEIRTNCTDTFVLESLVRESQHEKAEYRRLKLALDAAVKNVSERINEFLSSIGSLKRQRAAMSEKLQDWIFRQYIVHNALGESSSIANIFSTSGVVAPGGTGECAAPKLLEYAYRNGLKPLAMGEFWYGRPSETAVRTHGRFYPSCTSKCGPLLSYMMRGASTLSTCHPIDNQTVEPETQTPVIIYEDEAILVAEKPSGMPSVPGLDGRKSLMEWLGESRNIHSVHRLDMDTSGVMIFAKNAEAAVNLRHQFEEHTIRKTYMARVLAEGRLQHKAAMKEKTGVIDLPLSADYDERPRQKVDFKQGKTAHTEYRIVDGILADNNFPGTIDLLLYPHTGRTHQLRVHCAHSLGLGSPILGDLLYGAHSTSPAKQPGRLCLHALSITFTHPLTGAEQTFTSNKLCY